jgi:hypothetical protein
MKIFAFIAGILCFSVACNSPQNGNAASGSGSDTSAYMYFTEDEHNFGKIQEGATVSYTFWYENRGNQDLLIYDVRTSCGCTVASYDKKPIKKGQKGKIELRFDTTGKQGRVVKTATIHSNADPESKELRLICEVVLPNNK